MVLCAKKKGNDVELIVVEEGAKQEERHKPMAPHRLTSLHPTASSLSFRIRRQQRMFPVAKIEDEKLVVANQRMPR